MWTVFLILASTLVVAHHVQGPVHFSFLAILNEAALWSLDDLPNPNATDHLVFETVYSLLQHWPNTRMRNGHNVVPGTIPKGTLLYHGTGRKELPPGPEWVALDPEHAYYYCSDAWGSMDFRAGCWFLTLTTTRPFKIVYFDGSSAAKFPGGSLDAQDLLIWGRSEPGDIYEEPSRIEALCRWVTKFGLDGIVRMAIDFELMLCDFTSGVHVVSSTNLESAEGIPPMMTGLVLFEDINAGSRYNHFPGETRVQLDLTGLISFYDTQLVPSLVAARAGQERWDHRLVNISSEDLFSVKSRLETIWTGSLNRSLTGIDWKTLVQVLVDRFAGRLELVRHLLDTSLSTSDEILDLASKIQIQLRIMLTPYLLLSATPTDPSDGGQLGWAIPTYKLCSTMHTYSMESELDSMTESEKLILQAVRVTSREICRVVTKMWVAGVYSGIDVTLNKKEFPDISEVTRVWSTWAKDLGGLMAWLDWAVWVRCDPKCEPEQLCYLPTWPVGFPGVMWPTGIRRRRQERSAGSIPPFDIDSKANEWVRPQPKCVRVIEPYSFEWINTL